ncbi:hypothetical protein SAMN02910456_01542 [Ruminococcaceae bacterium YRB3002]|nr:hypothetical protein SAMN02910456_01542 [Ruminococcaceae bacterium YRB3002]
MFTSPSYRQAPRGKRSSGGKLRAFSLAVALMVTALSGCTYRAQDDPGIDIQSSIMIEKEYDPSAPHIEDFDILINSEVNTYEAGMNFWNLYFFDSDRNIYVDEPYPIGTKAMILQVHTFSYNKVGDVFLYDVYKDGELLSEHNVFTNRNDLADYCEITYSGDGKGLDKGRYTFVIYDVNSTSSICCVAYCVVQ